jgi:prepilin-type N-terminal cleavage/methylation domain-containing protein
MSRPASPRPGSRAAPAGRRRGFTLIEVMVATAILGTILLLFTEVFQRSSSLEGDSRAVLHADDDCRRSLEYIRNILRGAYYPDTNAMTPPVPNPLPAGISPAPVGAVEHAWGLVFRRVTGITPAGPAFGPWERMRWRPLAPGTVDGVTEAGEVVRETSVAGGDPWVFAEVVAPRVPRVLMTNRLGQREMVCFNVEALIAPRVIVKLATWAIGPGNTPFIVTREEDSVTLRN